MNFFKKILPVLLFFAFCMIIPSILYAQPIDPCTDPFAYCPIDDNVILLIVAVILLAAYKFIAYSKSRFAR